MLLHLEIPIGGSVKKSWAECVCLCVSVCVCVSVCPSISDRSAQTAGPIGTGVAPFGAPTRRNDDDAGRGSVGATCHVRRGAGKPLHENFCQGYRSNGWRPGCPVCRLRCPHREPRSFGVSVPEGCTAHVRWAENFFDKGSSGSGKR